MLKSFSILKIVTLLGISFFLTFQNTKAQSVVWAKQFGSTGFNQGMSVTTGMPGYIYTAGDFNDTLSMGSNTLISAGGTAVYVTKMDTSGNVIWARRFGNINGGTMGSVTTDNAGGVYITGSYVVLPCVFDSYTLAPLGSVDVFVVKLDASNGNVLWAKSLGGAGYDQGLQVISDKAANIYVCGSFFLTATFGTYSCTSAGNRDMFVAKMNATNGNVDWVRPVGGPNNEIAVSIAQDAFGNIYATGGFVGSLTIASTTLNSIAGSSDAYIVKLDFVTGNPLWTKRLGAESGDEGYSLVADSAGYIYQSGFFASTVAFDSFTLTAGTYSDGYLIKMNPINGNVLWVKNTGIRGLLATDNKGYLYLSDRFYNAINIDTTTLIPAGIAGSNQADIALVKIAASSGNITWIKQLGGVGNDICLDHTLDMNGNIYMTGAFGGVTAFDSYTFTSGNGTMLPSHIFVLKIGNNTGTLVTTGLENNIITEDFQLWPNPFKDELSISLNNTQTEFYKLYIHDVLGRNILEIKDNRQLQKLNLTELKSGIYFINIIDDKGSRINKKIIKE